MAPIQRLGNHPNKGLRNMLFSFFFVLLASSAVVFAELNDHVGKSTKACTRELEGIVYTPMNCGFEYLKRITETLRIQSPTFWNNPVQAKAAFETFSNTYGVFTLVITPFGQFFPYIGAPASELVYRNVYGPPIARANVLGEGFNYDIVTKSYYYITNFWGPDGQMFQILVSMPKADAPVTC